jgi:hypothetical protein
MVSHLSLVGLKMREFAALIHTAVSFASFFASYPVESM